MGRHMRHGQRAPRKARPKDAPAIDFYAVEAELMQTVDIASIVYGFFNLLATLTPVQIPFCERTDKSAKGCRN